MQLAHPADRAEFCGRELLGSLADLEWGRNKLTKIDLRSAPLAKQLFQPFGTARCMEEERDHYQILVISIIDGVRKGIQNNSSKVLMNNPVYFF